MMRSYTKEEHKQLGNKLEIFIERFLKEPYQLYKVNRINDDNFIHYQCFGKDIEFTIILCPYEDDDVFPTVCIDSETVLKYLEKKFNLDIFNKTKKSLNDLDFLHCYLFGRQANYSYTYDEMISNYYYDGDNFIFEGSISTEKGNGFEVGVFIDIMIDLDAMNCHTMERWILKDFSSKNNRDLLKHKRDILKHYGAKKLGKDIKDLRMHDHKLLAILNYI